MCVDDHRVMLDGLALLIGRQPDMEVVATATTVDRAVSEYVRVHPDITLMDLQLPDSSGVEGIRQIRSLSPNARIVVLTMYHGDEDIYRSLEAGAVTYVLKEALSDDLVTVIRQVNAGHRPMTATMEAQLEQRRQQSPLTPRQIEVARLIADGLRNKEIAVALGISEQTAKVHVKNILSKLRVTDRAAIIAAAARRGIFHL
jgi:DNA-binding NarL/FixJ family response regulator